jgi:hypothetical protein
MEIDLEIILYINITFIIKNKFNLSPQLITSHYFFPTISR